MYAGGQRSILMLTTTFFFIIFKYNYSKTRKYDINARHNGLLRGAMFYNIITMMAIVRAREIVKQSEK